MQIEQARFLLHNLELQSQQVRHTYRTFAERELKEHADQALRHLQLAAVAVQRIVDFQEQRNAPQQHQG